MSRAAKGQGQEGKLPEGHLQKQIKEEFHGNMGCKEEDYEKDEEQANLALMALTSSEAESKSDSGSKYE